MTRSAAEPAGLMRQRLLGWTLALLGVLYLLQMTSPLRLNTDAIIFLYLGQSAAAGQGFLLHGRPTHFPIGYPAMLAGLDLAGLGASWAFIGLNCLFVALAVAASYGLYRRAFGFSGLLAMGLCALLLLCYVLVKHVTLPVSDVVFLGLATAALLACQRAESHKQWLPLAGGLVIGAVAVRTVGFALVPAWLWASLPQSIVGDAANRRRALTAWAQAQPYRAAACGAGLLLILAGAVLTISRTAYVREAGEIFRHFGGPLAAVGWLANHRLLEWAEIAVNVPASKLPPTAEGLLPLVGALVLVMVLGGFWLRRQVGSLEIFLLAYLFILACWPYYDARFLLPVVPVALGGLGMWFVRLPRIWRTGLYLWLGCYVLAGGAVLFYSTQLSFAGARFPELYGGPDLKPSYRAAFGQSFEPEKVNDDALALLRTYGKREGVPP